MRILTGTAKWHALNMLIFVSGLILAVYLALQCKFMPKVITAKIGLETHAEHIVEIKQCSNIDFEMVAKCVLAEAGTESDYCKRLVADCIYNQAELFDMTPEAVIYKPKNFEVVSKRMIDKAKPTEKDLQLVQEEFYNRTCSEVLYFRTDYFHTFGTPLIRLKNMYFSAS